MGGFPLIVPRAIDFCWFCCKWGLLLGAVGAAVAAVPYFYRRVDEEIRSRVQAQIAQHYPGLQVTVGSAEWIEGEGIHLRRVAIVEPGAEGPCPELLQVEEVILGCQTSLQELLQGEPRLTQIILRRPTLRITRRPDGTWSAAKLLPLPRASDHPIETRIEGATIEILDPLKSPSGALAFHDVQLVLTPCESSGEPTATPGARKVCGTLTGDHVRGVRFEGQVDLQAQAWTLGGAVEGLEISPALLAAVPEPWSGKLAALAAVRGQSDLTFRVSHDPAAAVPCQFQLAGRLTRGRIDDPRLPHPLTDVRAAVRANNEGFEIEDCLGHSNQATVRLSCRQLGYERNARKTIDAELRGVDLDRRLLAVLPESLQEQWHRYRPAGVVDADAKLSYDGQGWIADLSVRCLNVSFTHYKFPYRLEEGKGTVTLKDDVLRLAVTAYSGSQPVRLEAEWARPTTAPTGWFEARGEELPLDSKLLAALPEPSRAVVRALNPRGTVNFYVRMWRDQPEQPLHKHLVLYPNRCSIQYERFPYPLRNIRGTLEMFDNSWTFRSLEGFNDPGRVTCEGYLTPTLAGNELSLRLVGTDVPLDEELRDALRPNEQQVWHVLRPRGAVDLVADVRYLTESQQLSVAVRAQTHRETTAIEPIHFPYRMEKLQGLLSYRDGRVTIEQFKAEHGPVKIASGGYCDFFPDGRWHLQLAGLSVDRLRLDRDLIQVLPARLKKALVELRPAGPVNVRGTFELEPGPRAGDPVQSRWDVLLGFHQGSIECGVKLTNIYGTLALKGGCDGTQFSSRGELALDSLVYKDCQFTQVIGPMWIDDRQALFGAWVARSQNQPPAGPVPRPPESPRRITAHLFGGTVEADGWVAFGAEPRYGLHATLTRADLARCARELMAGPQNLRGTIFASLDLRGSGHSTNALGGRGSIRLTDGDVYELPLMIALLKILSVRAPDPNAFSHSNMDFRIEGEHVYFDRLDFNGDAISLRGTGEMDFQQAVKLCFHAVVGRGDVNLPILKELFSGASRQIMLIHVDGTLQNPETRKEAFPGVNQAIQQLQGERPKGDAPPGAFPQGRGF